jgi:membrane protein required for beta-lactamase induction
MFKNAIERFKMPWSLMRVLYLIVGAFMLVQASIDKLWFGIIIGGYFVAMGLFSWGCAGGQCAVPESKPAAESDIKTN